MQLLGQTKMQALLISLREMALVIWNRVSKQIGPYYAGWKDGVVSISGNYAIAGTSYDYNDENDSDSLYMAGSAFIFERNSSGTWEMVQKIVASDRAKMDHFGTSVVYLTDMPVVGVHS